MTASGTTTYEAMLDEIRRSCWLTPEQVRRMEAVSASWARCLIRMPSQRRWMHRAAEVAACRMLLLGEATPTVRDRLQAMGLSRRSAYRVIAQARVDIERHAAGAARG
ncbi:MAG: hypothetical protein HYZ20_19680 [Burkholderiales bacterium]|nr:hypothetical protein [Burkholderiales bacterium]